MDIRRAIIMGRCPVAIMTDAKFSLRAFVSADLFKRVTTRISQEQCIDVPLAERIMDEVLSFLKTCADHPHMALVPSRSVDIGWHTFLLYTRDYGDFCDRVAGRFIHHEPEDAPDGSERDQNGSIRDTVAVMRASGAAIDETLWTVEHDPPCRGSAVDRHPRSEVSVSIGTGLRTRAKEPPCRAESSGAEQVDPAVPDVCR